MFFSDPAFIVSGQGRTGWVRIWALINVKSAIASEEEQLQARERSRVEGGEVLMGVSASKSQVGKDDQMNAGLLLF